MRTFVAALLGLAAVAAIALTSPSIAASDCILDNCADQRGPAAPERPSASAPAGGRRYGSAPRGASAPGDFDFYVLSLSWSAGFCETGGAEKARRQCEPGANLGFVVHGLWPQYEHGFPSDCGPAGRSPSQIALQSVDGVFPDQGLARYEWRKHGTCSGKSPTDYFADVRRARDMVAVPPPFRDARQPQTWTPIDIERAFIAANPQLRPGMMGVACKGNVLQEVRICLSKDVRGFVPCAEVSRQACRSGQVSVPAML